MRIHEISIFRDNRRPVTIRKFGDQPVGGSIPKLQALSMLSIVSESSKLQDQASWQLRIDDKFHAAGKVVKDLIFARRAAYACAALKSSGSKSG